MIVRRLAIGDREVLEHGELDVVQGLVGEHVERPEDVGGIAHSGMQISI